MSKFNIKWSEQKPPTATGKLRMVATLTDENNSDITNVTIWGNFPGYAELMSGHDVEGILIPAKDPKYGPSLSPIKTNVAPRGNWGAKKDIVAGQLEVQSTITKNVERAQDRNAWMYAKQGATELVAHHPAYKFLLKEQIVGEIEDLATKIYHAEPLTPFN